MVQLFAFRRSLRFIALAMCSMALAVVSISPASARSHHGTRSHHSRHYASAHHAGRYLAYRHYRHVTRRSRWDAGVAQVRAGGFANTNASIASGTASAEMASSGSYGSSGIVSEARRYLGGNPTGRGSLWCARFMNRL
jgi:hypothetical protein